MNLTKKRIIFNSILFIIFTLFAVIQLNDPDPIHWFAIYGIVALISLIAIFKKISKLLIYFLSIALLVYAGYHFLYFIDYLKIEDKKELFGEMVYEKPYLEGTREFFGLILATLSLLFQLKKPVTK
jgi:hypothetical protein